MARIPQPYTNYKSYLFQGRLAAVSLPLARRRRFARPTPEERDGRAHYIHARIKFAAKIVTESVRGIDRGIIDEQMGIGEVDRHPVDRFPLKPCCQPVAIVVRNTRTPVRAADRRILVSERQRLAGRSGST